MFAIQLLLTANPAGKENVSPTNLHEAHTATSPGRTLRHCLAATMLGLAFANTATAQTGTLGATTGLHPNLAGQLEQKLRYQPEGEDFVIANGQEFFNRSLYGGNTAFRVDGGDKPEFMLYLPGRGGNLRLGIKNAHGITWLHAASSIVSRYRPGELHYEVRDGRIGAAALIRLEVLAYHQTEGLVLKAQGTALPAGTELVWAYGGVNGKRGVRDGDIGTEKVPISSYFQFQPAFAQDNAIALDAQGFSLKSAAGTIGGVVPDKAQQAVADGEHWNDTAALFRPAQGRFARPVVIGRAPMRNGQALLLSLQRTAGSAAQELKDYADVTARKQAADAGQRPAPALLPLFAPSALPAQFAAARAHFTALRQRVRINTPDPHLNAAMGALNVVADALWDERAQAIMHGSIAWRTKLLGWRGPYALDALGWHERARGNFDTWIPRQNTETAPATLPPADVASNLARNEAGLHSNGDLSNSHYDMNMVFIDALFRHLLWSGDRDYARQVWPVIERHLAWEQRLFRREFGADKLPLYEAYAAIWASDELYYHGGGATHATAYNLYANRMAARLAPLAGKDPAPYLREAALIERGLNAHLWMAERGAFAESRDLMGLQRLHPDYALWSFYHTVDEEAASPKQAWLMGKALARDFRAIPVQGAYHVYPSSRWMPYTWSINNVVNGENLHAALALWQGGHAEQAYALSKGSLLASMFMGISPGNVGTMNLYDVYRRESQRDFADGTGVMARAIVEGLFGIRPDALAQTLTIVPGLPGQWKSASIEHPDLRVGFRRKGLDERWEIGQSAQRFSTLVLRLPARFDKVASVRVNGVAVKWSSDAEAVGRALLQVRTAFAGKAVVDIKWAGKPFVSTPAGEGLEFVRAKRGNFSWWAQSGAAPAAAVPAAAPGVDWNAPLAQFKGEPLDLAPHFNDRVSEIFRKGKYRSPRSPYVSLALPSQGLGGWAGHVNQMAIIDDAGLRKVSAANGGFVRMPNGVAFATPGAAGSNNIVFTSQWDNYPREASMPLSGQARRVYLLMAGSTNHMQSRIDNGEVIVAYADGSSARLALSNPVNWWPIEQDYLIDDYQFPLDGALPPRIDLKTGTVRLLDAQTFKGRGRTVDGGAATVLELALDPSKPLQSLTVRTLSNDVVIGLMSATLERP